MAAKEQREWDSKSSESVLEPNKNMYEEHYCTSPKLKVAELRSIEIQ